MSAHDDIERVARLSQGRLVVIVTSRTGNVTAAMDALSDAVLRALEIWPVRGVPDRPEAWLVATARKRAADAGRQSARAARAADTLALLEEERADMGPHSKGEAATPDRTLNLMFVCAHPAIEARMRTPLMLQLVLGLDARRMAGAFLIPPGTLGQRLSRARAKIEAARIGFSLPDGDDVAPRLSHVLDAIYAAFTVGTDGDGAGDAKSTSLAREALWLGSLVAAQMPRAAEAQAIFALMLYTQARIRADRDRPITGTRLLREWQGCSMSSPSPPKASNGRRGPTSRCPPSPARSPARAGTAGCSSASRTTGGGHDEAA